MSSYVLYCHECERRIHGSRVTLSILTTLFARGLDAQASPHLQASVLYDTAVLHPLELTTANELQQNRPASTPHARWQPFTGTAKLLFWALGCF